MLIQDLSATKRKFFLTLVQKRVKSGTGSGINFLSQRTWNSSVTDLKSILKQAPFVVVGGIATRMYMPERMTLDIDILGELLPTAIAESGASYPINCFLLQNNSESYIKAIGFAPRSVGHSHGIIELCLCIWLGYRHSARVRLFLSYHNFLNCDKIFFFVGQNLC